MPPLPAREIDRRPEPRLLPFTSGIKNCLLIILIFEWTYICLEIAGLIAATIGTSGTSNPSFFGLVFIGTGTWALVRLGQARVRRDPALLVVYLTWKAFMVIIAATAATFSGVAVVKVFEADARPAAIAMLTIGVIFVAQGVWFLSYVARCRAFFLKPYRTRVFVTNSRASTEFPTMNFPWLRIDPHSNFVDGYPPQRMPPPTFDDPLPLPSYQEAILAPPSGQDENLAPPPYSSVEKKERESCDT